MCFLCNINKNNNNKTSLSSLPTGISAAQVTAKVGAVKTGRLWFELLQLRAIRQNLQLECHASEGVIYLFIYLDWLDLWPSDCLGGGWCSRSPAFLIYIFCWNETAEWRGWGAGNEKLRLGGCRPWACSLYRPSETRLKPSRGLAWPSNSPT